MHRHATVDTEEYLLVVNIVYMSRLTLSFGALFLRKAIGECDALSFPRVFELTDQSYVS